MAQSHRKPPDDAEAAATAQALDMMQSMYARAITHNETVAIYREAIDVWQTQINQTWHATSRRNHACTTQRCKMDALRISFVLIRGADFTDVASVSVCTHTDPTERYGGKYPTCDGATPPLARGESLVRGEILDAYVCTATSLLHICNEKLCGGRAASDSAVDTATAAGVVCAISGIPYGGAPMVHKFWKPTSVAASSEGSALTRRDALCGRMAFARQRRSCISSQGATWSDFREWLDTVPLATFDTKTAMHRTVKEYNPKRDTLRDAHNEYMSWAIARVASLFSAKRVECDVDHAATRRDIMERHIRQIVRTSDRVLTVADIRVMQVEYMKRYKNKLSPIALPEAYRRNLVMIYAQKCMSYWEVICANTLTPGITVAARADQFIFPDFVVACMYIFAQGLKLSSDVTDPDADPLFATGVRIIDPDCLLALTLPDQAHLHQYTSDKSAVIAQQRAIKRVIIETVRDRFVDPMFLMPGAKKLADITIDMLPPLARHRDRKRKR